MSHAPEFQAYVSFLAQLRYQVPIADRPEYRRTISTWCGHDYFAAWRRLRRLLR